MQESQHHACVHDQRARDAVKQQSDRRHCVRDLTLTLIITSADIF
jgi:hypothetical protein